MIRKILEQVSVYPKYTNQRAPVHMHPGALPAAAVGPGIVRSPGHLPTACPTLPTSHWKLCHSIFQACDAADAS